MTRFRVTEVQTALKGFDHPGKPMDLARQAEPDGADGALAEALRNFDKKEGVSSPSVGTHELSAHADALAAHARLAHPNVIPRPSRVRPGE